MKVDTIQQYYVKQYLEDNFYIEELKLTLIDRYTILVEDCNQDRMYFYYDIESKKVMYREA